MHRGTSYLPAAGLGGRLRGLGLHFVVTQGVDHEGIGVQVHLVARLRDRVGDLSHILA